MQYRDFKAKPRTAEERQRYYEAQAASLRIEGFEFTAAELEAMERQREDAHLAEIASARLSEAETAQELSRSWEEIKKNRGL